VLASAFDRYADDWQVTYRDACEATRVRRDHTETVMESRMRCLRRRRAQLDALIEIARKPDADLMADATNLVGRLDAPGTCASVESLDKEISDPKRRADVEQLETEVDEAKALQAANRLDASSARILDVRKRADKINHPPLLAELELQLGLNAYTKLDLEVAEKHLHRAVEIAEQVGADRVRARAFLDLISIAATRTRLDEAERWQRYAQSTIIRLGNDRELAAQLELRVAVVLQQRGNAKLAESTFKSAIDKLAAIHGGSSRQVALARRQLAGFYHATNNYDLAFDEHRAVRDLMQAARSGSRRPPSRRPMAAARPTEAVWRRSRSRTAAPAAQYAATTTRRRAGLRVRLRLQDRAQRCRRP
jgi:tetratricopeptide (TPR) repeat protein